MNKQTYQLPKLKKPTKTFLSMNYARVLKIYITTVCIFGSAAIFFALFNLKTESLTWFSTLLLISALLITSRLTLSLPRSKSNLSFSDTIIFFAFLQYSGELAILLATLEALVSCYYLKYKGFKFKSSTIAANVSISAIATTITYFVWSVLPFLGFPHSYSDTSNLISTLAILSLTQFIALSTFIAVFYSLRAQANIWQAWKDICFSSSMTQIAGAGLAGVMFKLLGYGNAITIIFSGIVFGVAYLNYRQMIRNINTSIDEAEEAQREKANVERLKAEEAQEHAGQLEILLEKEEKISQDLRQSKKDLEYAVFHDNLTDLPNRAYLIERLNLLLQLGVEVSQRYYVLFLDLSRFKNINDSLGHTIGDEVLKVVALRLRRTLRDEDTIARLGGDEFAIILNDLSSIEEAKSYAQKIYGKLTEPYMIQGNKIHSGLHIGIAPFDSEQIKPEDVLRDADIAMHNAKEKNAGIAVFDKEVRAQYLEHIRLESDLRYAIDRQELEMNYQPLISLKDGELIGFEALLRWHHSDLGFISPARFIPISEDSGLILPITRWILEITCSQLANWQEISDDYKDLMVSVNISGRHLNDNRLIDDVKNALDYSGLPAHSLKLEITETIAMENPDNTIEILHNLKKLGVKISIDDFGTGYSSLNYLHKLPFDTLKIDRSFVNNATQEDEDSEILQTIVSLTKNLKKEIIAEGVETVEQLKLLQDLDCEYAQGYLFSRPLPKGDMETMLYKKSNWLPKPEEETSQKSPSKDINKEKRLQIF